MPTTTMMEARVTGLHSALKDTFQLYLDTHIAHWNVRGPDFPQLHAMFEEQYTDMWTALDTIAERLRGLGQNIEKGDVTGGPSLEGIDAGATVRTLAAAHRNLSARLADLEQAASEAGDSGTADLATERIRAHDQMAWMLEAISEA